MAENLRAVIIGASTLLGKELIDELNSLDAAWDVRLTDVAETGGQLVDGGNEPLVVQPVTPDVFEGTDIAFFAGNASTTRAHWREAKKANATVVDLTGALEAEPGVLVRSPWITGGKAPDRNTSAVVPAHPAAAMLGLVGSRLVSRFGPTLIVATVLEPASQQGARGMDEMHQQTVNLLGFHSLPQDLYGAQVAFNLRVDFGETAELDLGEIAETIRRHVGLVAGKSVESSTSIQLVQAPVFHGYTMSVFVRTSQSTDLSGLRASLQNGVIQVDSAADEAPSNQSITQEGGIRIAIREDAAQLGDTHGFWLWMAADNLKLAARQAIACAEEMSELRASMPRQ